MVYNVLEMLEDLDGHELDTVIKIKLNDGTIKEIAGFQFINGCIGGDDIIYIKEENLWDKYHNEVGVTICNMKEIIKLLKRVVEHKYVNDPDWALECIIRVAEECDYWLNKLNIEHDFEPLTGPEYEVIDKIELLSKWLNSH